MLKQSGEASPLARLYNSDPEAIEALLHRLGLFLERVAPGREIVGSFWGDEEAGLLGNRLLARDDTPVHSILHEACHFICMDESRRGGLDTDAGGDYDEENAVCYLQVVLADELPGMGRDRMLRDMDEWGYTFRLGSARAWFDQDAADARNWLLKHALLTPAGKPTFKRRYK
jgi:hypothetical protein